MQTNELIILSYPLFLCSLHCVEQVNQKRGKETKQHHASTTVLLWLLWPILCGFIAEAEPTLRIPSTPKQCEDVVSVAKRWTVGYVDHSIETAAVLQQSSTPICNDYRRTGFCRMGNNCPYRHIAVTDEMREDGMVIPCWCVGEKWWRSGTGWNNGAPNRGYTLGSGGSRREASHGEVKRGWPDSKRIQRETASLESGSPSLLAPCS